MSTAKVLDDYPGAAADSSGVRYAEELTHAAGVSAGRWMRSQQCSYRIRAVASELDDVSLRSILELLAQEIEAGQ